MPGLEYGLRDRSGKKAASAMADGAPELRIRDAGPCISSSTAQIDSSNVVIRSLLGLSLPIRWEWSIWYIGHHRFGWEPTVL